MNQAQQSEVSRGQFRQIINSDGDAIEDLSQICPLTAIERAQIQTFPKDFKWPIINKSTHEQLIGNAVPVNFAKFVGTAIMSYVKENESKTELVLTSC